MSLESLLSGQVVNGKYLLCEPLGGGGNGVVFRAEQVLKMLMGRPVSIAQDADYAVKIIARNDDAPDRFLSELRLATTLNHPHILHGYETGTTTLYKQDFLFLVMEKAEASLAAQLAPDKRFGQAQNPLSPDEALELARCLVSALDYTHNLSNPVIHFDLKPSNVLRVCDRGGQTSWKLADFGIARVLQGTGAHLTMTSAGSQSYKPPERFGMMDFSAIDPAHDLWQLGITLLEALGKIPIGGGEQIAVQALMKQNYVPPEDIPSPLREIIADCLVADWRERITARSARNLFYPAPAQPPQMERVAVGEPPLARPVASPARASKPVVVERPVIGSKINPKDGAEMVLIPAGEFLRGTCEEDIKALIRQFPNARELFEAETPLHKVHLEAYSIYKTPVTVAMYRRFCQETKRKFDTIYMTPAWGWKDDHPMVNVSWHDAEVYCQWAGGALPTEAQWEKAARGTDGREYPWGKDWDVSKCHNFLSGTRQTTPVGQYPQGTSPYGVLDMAGNVWEWCADWYDANYYKNAPNQNPTGPQIGMGRAMRGGGWCSGDPDLFRCANRYWDNSEYRNDDNGFRCVLY